MGRDQHWSFSANLDQLCEHPPRGHRYSNTELSRLVAQRGGNITPGYLSLLRNGDRDNPTLEVLEHLAAALDVCPAAFVGGRHERQGDEQPRRSFSARLVSLFSMVYPPGRGPWSPEEVAKAITAKATYGSISASYLRELMTPSAGTLPNPRLKHVLALADHFGLNREGQTQAAYFLDDVLAALIDAELGDFAALRSAGVLEFVTRLADQAPTWRPELREQVVRAFTDAVRGDTDWVFRAPKPPTDWATGE
ncbi:helix-turn-helix transcriptional regulator [Actinoplanes sp. NPDC051475]|uniref:helix-turn-helix domain-containing protein n=1 Tax=Actinoplanes sp. NPDC051475 TaxID=3157225 RepID=UPI00344FD41C